MKSNEGSSNARKIIGKYQLLKILGKGEYGTVYYAVDQETKKEYAIKSQSKSCLQDSENYMKLLNTEIKILLKIDHPNILKLHDLMETTNNYYLVLDYCNQGDFSTYLKGRKIRYLSEKEAIFFLKQIRDGFMELQKHKIIHRDFKMANIMIHNNTLKIGDFGQAKKGHEFTKTIVGSYMTMAPELLTSDGLSLYTAKADLWSIGFVYYQLLFGDFPFFGLSPSEIYADIKQKSSRLAFPIQISQESKNLLDKMLKMNPEERMTWEEFRYHPIFGEENPMKELITETSNLMLANDKKNIFGNNFSRVRDATPELKLNWRDTSEELKTSKVNNQRDQSPNTSKSRLGTPKSFNNQKSQNSRNSKMIAMRYSHEKNKIIFMIYTVRQSRRIYKHEAFSLIQNKILCITLILLKKTLLLNDLNYKSLIEHNNIFEFEGFVDFVQTEGFLYSCEMFKSEGENIRKYWNYLLELCVLNPPEVLKLIETKNATLEELDAHLVSYLKQIEMPMFSIAPEIRKEYLIFLYSMNYCISSETAFPFKVSSELFNWRKFYENLSNAQEKEILPIVNQMKMDRESN